MKAPIANALVFTLLLAESFAQDLSQYHDLPLNNMYIQKMLSPSAFVGLLPALFFVSLILVAIYQMMAIQCPIFFHHENKENRWSKVNWGKVEHDA